MAEAISYEHAPRNVRQELYEHLHSAPDQHVEAMLDVYAILQLLRDKGVLEMVKDALGAGEKVAEIIIGVMQSEEVVRTIRNLTILAKMLGSIEPDTLEKMMRSLSAGTEAARHKKAPGLLRLLGQLSSADTRRALEPVAAALQSIGRSMPETKPEERSHTTRHSA